MKRSIQRPFSFAMAFVMFIVLSAQEARAHEHILSLDQLQGDLRSAANQRAKNLEDLQRVLSYPAAAAALSKSHVGQEQMRSAVATLTDTELARLADRARASEKDVEGGIVIGLLALIGLIVVIVIVLSLVAVAAPGPQPEAERPALA